MEKRGQVTFYVIIAVVILIIVAVIFFMRNNVPAPGEKPNVPRILSR